MKNHQLDCSAADSWSSMDADHLEASRQGDLDVDFELAFGLLGFQNLYLSWS